MTKKTSRKALSLLLLAAAACPVAYAVEPGWYVGGNVGGSMATIDDARISKELQAQGLTTTTISDRNRDTGYKLFGGYQFNRNLALEGGYFDMGTFGFTANTLPAGTLRGDLKLQGLNLDVVGLLPMTERLSLLGRVGANYAETSDSFTGSGAVQVLNPNPSKRETNYKLGLGLQYAMTDALAVRLEAERLRMNDAVGNMGHVDLVSVGLVYYFGKKAVTPVRYVAPPPPPPAVVVAPPAPVAPVPAPAPPPPPAPRFERYTLSATELFGFDSAQLRMPQAKLDEIAAALALNSQVTNVVITGYADHLGSTKYNQALSERRAIAVRDYLTRKGLDAGRLRAEGKGEANPVVQCSNKNRAKLIECLEPNRRVEIEQITVQRRVQ